MDKIQSEKTKTHLLLRKTLVLVSVIAGFIAVSLVFSSKVEAATNDSGYGWAMPTARIGTNPCSNLAWGSAAVIINVVNADNGSPVNANIWINYAGLSSATAKTTFGSTINIDCVNVNNGVWLAVWGASGFKAWDQSTPFRTDAGGTGSRQFNWCCGLKLLNVGGADANQVNVIYVYLEPTSHSYTIRSSNASTTGTSTAPGVLAGTNATFSIDVGRQCPCDGMTGNPVVSLYMWLNDLTTGSMVVNGNIAQSVGFNSTITYNRTLTVGHTYQWYAQYLENWRSGSNESTMPITSQIPWQYFTVQSPQPDLVIRNTSGGTSPAINGPTSVTTGTSVTYQAITRNIGSASAGGSTTRATTSGSSNNLQDYSIGGLSSGVSSGVSSFATSWAAPGTYTVTFNADQLSNVAESNEGNNSASITVTVTAPLLGIPVLNSVPPQPCVASGSTYGTGVGFSWSNILGATSYDIELSTFANQDPTTGSFVNAGGGGFRVVKTGIAGTSTTGTGGWVSVGGAPQAVGGNLNLSPGITYYWHVASRNAVVTTKNWSSTGSFSAAICPASGFTVKITTPAAAPHTRTIQAGDSANYIVTVTAVGNFDGTVTLTPTWVGAPPANVSFFSLLPNPVSVGSPFPVSVSSTLVINSTTAASLGSFNFTVTGTSSGFPAQSDTGNLVINPPPPGGPAWIQTIKGDVGSVGSIDLTSPDLTKNNGDYLTITNNTFTKPFREIKNWLIKTSPPYYPAPLLPANDPKTYLDFVNKFTSSTTTALPPGPGLPGNKGVWRTSGSFSWNGTKSAADCDVLKKQATVIFVDGQLNINGNSFSTNCPLVIFVGGNVVVSPAVSTINAVIFTGSLFKTESLPPDNTLTIWGAVLSQGGFYIAGPNPSTLKRDLVINNQFSPAEKFIYQPKYLWYLSDYIGIAKNHFSEVKP